MPIWKERASYLGIPMLVAVYKLLIRNVSTGNSYTEHMTKRAA